MQIRALRKLLLECKQNGTNMGVLIKPDYMAAPENDSLFDCLQLYAKAADNNTVELSGTVYYWNPVDGTREVSVLIHTFNNIDDCISWLSDEASASEECAGRLQN